MMANQPHMMIIQRQDAVSDADDSSNLHEHGLAHSNRFDSTLRNIYHEHADLGGQSSFGCWDEIVDDGLDVEEESGGFRRMNRLLQMK